jgi:CheY-like chemotaxis protein
MNLTNIMLVEDDNLDVIDIKRSLDKMKVLYKLHVAKNGEEAIGILNGQGEHALETLPDIVLIDLNMPKMNGIEFLSEVRKNEKWKSLKCFIITTSDEPVDREAATSLGVSGYIIKPLKLNNPSKDSLNLLIDLINLKTS